MSDVYRELSKKIMMENSVLIPEIWKIVCSEEEANILNAMPATLAQLAEKFGKSRDEMNAVLEDLFHRGVVFDYEKGGETFYRMPRHIVQFHDATILWQEAPQKMIDLWVKYMNEEFHQIPELLTSIKYPPFFRVIPINEGIASKSTVLPYEDALTIVEQATNIAVTKCTCRLIMKKCDRPLEVCMQLNKGADYAIRRGTGRKLTVEEAKKMLRDCEKAGLVHTTENKSGVGTVLCNCCECCCEAIPYMRHAATRGIVSPSRYRASVDIEFCSSCGSCVDICPVDAIALDDEGFAVVDGDLCIGCGLCTGTCPVEAITLVQVRDESFIP